MTDINEGDQAFRAGSLKGKEMEIPFGGAPSVSPFGTKHH